MTTFDAIVAGAGPAGSTAARELAAAGARVLVIDRATFPRYKACGGGIPLRTERLLSFPIRDVIENSVHLLDVRHRGRCCFVRDSGSPFAHMVMRDRFDTLLLDQARAAGAAVRTGSAVRSLALEADGVSVACQDGFVASGSFLVGADGVHSPVGQMAALGDGMAECAAWEVEVAAPADRLRAVGERAIIDVGYRPWGYAWAFPKARLLSTGIVLPRERAAEMRPRVESFVAALGFQGASVEVRRGHKIRMRRGGEQIARGRVLLAGDAAGLADGFTQEGIGYAIQSGRLAARGVLRALAGQGTLEPYQADVDLEIMPELRAARLIGAAFYAGLRRSAGAWLTASRFMPGLWPAFFAVQRGESTYRREVERIPFLTGAVRRFVAWP